MMKYIELDNAKFTTLIIDPTVALNEDKHFHCLYCGKWLMSMNRKFAVASSGLNVLGIDSEVPLNVFRMTRFCGSCRHYYICYLDGKGVDL